MTESTTFKSINNRFKNVYGTWSCNIQEKYKPFADNSGIYGINYRVYEVKGNAVLYGDRIPCSLKSYILPLALLEHEDLKKVDTVKLKKLMGYREQEIFNNLGKVETIQKDEKYHVLRFWKKDNLNYFEYELNSNKITG